MRGFRVGSIRGIPPKGGAPATMPQLDTARPIAIPPCFARKGCEWFRHRTIVVVTMPRRIYQMNLASQASCRNCSSSRIGVDLQGTDAIGG
jgi:hypothetical protein